MVDRIEVQNVGRPGKTYRVDAVKHAVMRAVMERVFPDSPPGLTPAEIIEALRPNLSETQFPRGETVGWRGSVAQIA